MNNKEAQVYGCAVGASVGMVGGKWKTSILLHLRDQTLRFGSLQRLVGCSQKVLTQQLKELEHDGIVQRQVYAEVPPRVEYSLSTYGRTLQPVLDALYAWGREHYMRGQAAPAGLTEATAQVACPEPSPLP
jgi:DNA-binding HxlR family transcriptional regulator